jgi:hypothetical protein
MVDVELTAEPIVDIIANMSDAAVKEIRAKAATVATNGNPNVERFDWAAVAVKAVKDAEQGARKAVLSYVGPVSEEAFKRAQADGHFGDDGSPSVTPAIDVVEDGKGKPVDVPMEFDEEEGPALVSRSATAAKSVEPEDARMVEAGDAEAVGAGAAAAADADDDWGGKTCFCGEQENGDEVYECSGNANCPHHWYHKICIEKVVLKKSLPTDDPLEEWKCPYCGKYKVKAAMTWATVHGKGGSTKKN